MRHDFVTISVETVLAYYLRTRNCIIT